MLNRLFGGDRRFIGRADEVVEDIISDPSLFGEVFWGMKHQDPLVRMRSADAIEKVARLHPEYLQPGTESLLRDISRISQREVRWHVAPLLSYLQLEGEDLEEAAEMLSSWAQEDGSRIVQVNVMQSLADIARDDARLRSRVICALQDLVIKGSPPVRSRGKRLLRELE